MVEHTVPPAPQSGHAPQVEPPFNKIAVVGLGLIGGSLAMAARRAWPRALVIGVDDKEVIEKAMSLNAVDVAADDLIVVKEADLIVLAAPVEENIALLDLLPQYVPGAAVVTDVSSTKRAIIEAAGALPRRLTFVGGHPLGGAARSGIEFAKPDLFAGQPWLFVPPIDGGGHALDRLFALATGVGARPKTLSAVEHDRLFAFISHLPQLTVSALMHVVGTAVGETGLALAGRGLVDTTRLASSRASVWRDVCRTNGDFIGDALDVMIAAMQHLRADLDAGEVLKEIFASAGTWRAKLPDAGS